RDRGQRVGESRVDGLTAREHEHYAGSRLLVVTRPCRRVHGVSLRRHYPDQVRAVGGCVPPSQPGAPGSRVVGSLSPSRAAVSLEFRNWLPHESAPRVRGALTLGTRNWLPHDGGGERVQLSGNGSGRVARISRARSRSCSSTNTGQSARWK